MKHEIYFGKHDPNVGDDFYLNEFESVPEDMHFYREDLSDDPNIIIRDRETKAELKANGLDTKFIDGADVECEAPFRMEDGMLVWLVIGDSDYAWLYGLNSAPMYEGHDAFEAENLDIKYLVPDDVKYGSGRLVGSAYPNAPVIWYA